MKYHSCFTPPLHPYQINVIFINSTKGQGESVNLNERYKYNLHDSTICLCENCVTLEFAKSIGGGRFSRIWLSRTFMTFIREGERNWRGGSG